ncbi:MAG: DNA polymerase III subunit beta, partial [Rikenellaceae bacterium]
MKFTTSSGSLQHLLANTGKVINSKNTYPILDYFLLDLKGEQLTVTASDVETTIVSSITIESVERDGVIAAPSKLLMDTLKEFADMPITIDVNTNTWEIGISWKSGKLSIPGADPSSYPTITELADERRELEVSANMFIGGINSSLFATAD